MRDYPNKPSRLLQLQQEYALLQKQVPQGLQLSHLFGRLVEHGAHFQIHPQASEAEHAVRAFAQEYQVWLPHASPDTLTMAGDLHRSTVDLPRLILIGKLYIILFYIDDTMGNELQEYWTKDQAHQNQKVMQELITALEQGKTIEVPSPMVSAVLLVIADLNQFVDGEWLTALIEHMRRHLSKGTTDQDSMATGKVLTIGEYIVLRNDVSGMYTSIKLMTLCSNNVLPWAAIHRVDLTDDLNRLEYLCAAIGGLVNDFFSFEKEVFDENTDFNLIPLMMLAEPQMTMYEAIYSAAKVVNTVIDEFFELAVRVRERAAQHPFSIQIERHVCDLTDAVLATWHWQIRTKRYVREDSVFTEIRSSTPRAQPKSLSKHRVENSCLEA